MANGIDVSKYQGNIDFTAVKQAGTDFVIIRAGYGKYGSQKDPMFETNYRNAKKAGLNVGAYWYSYAKSVEDAKKEAEVFLEIIRGKTFEMPVAYDVEESAQAQKGKKFVSDVVRAFCERMEYSGYFVSVYANKFWLDNYIDDDVKRKYDIWLAQWSSVPTYTGKYGMWQNSSSGRVNGVSGRCDTDISYKNYPAIMREYALNGFKPQSPSKPLSKGTVISLYNTPVYISATAKLPATKKSGTYYIYDGIEINGRYRITNSVERVGKKPESKYVTGYVNASDIR